MKTRNRHGYAQARQMKEFLVPSMERQEMRDFETMEKRHEDLEAIGYCYEEDGRIYGT